MCAYPRKYCRTPVQEHKKDTVWCSNISGSKRNCIWHVGLIPTSKTNVKETKTSFTSELLCSSIKDPPQQKTIVARSDSGTSNNYLQTEDMLVLTNIKEPPDVPTVKLPNYATMNAKITGNLTINNSNNPYIIGTHFWWIAQCLAYLLMPTVWQWMHSHIRQEWDQCSKKRHSF